MISDPNFYLLAIPAVLLFGIAKGGFAGGFGIVAVPLMALVVSPVTAAAILLPILCLMDLVAVWKYRGRWVLSELTLLVPASLIGIGIGTLLFSVLSPGFIRLLLGIVSISFTVHYVATRLRWRRVELKMYGPIAGIVAAATSGFTSFIAHAGGPPLSMYMLRRGMDKTAFVATTAVFFTIVNYAKLVPYAWLGQFDSANLKTSLVLMPLAPVSILIGAWLHSRVSEKNFVAIVYTSLFFVGLKLLSDGISEL